MHLLSNQELIKAWDRGIDQRPIERAISILAIGFPEIEPDSIARLSMGERDELLIRLRETIFGPVFLGLATCPGCGERLELSFPGNEIAPPGKTSSEDLRLNSSEYEILFRLPNSLDILSIYGYEDLSKARKCLLDLCIRSARRGLDEIPTSQIPLEVLDAVVDEMARVDPLGDIQISISCSSCGHQWQMVFDILQFFWIEIDAWAHRTLFEVHRLAEAYGWSEAEILSMSPRRRHIYLDMVGE